MCTVLVSYDSRNKAVSHIMDGLALMKGVKVRYDYKENHYKNGIDEAIDDIKNGRVSEPQSFDNFKKEMDKMLGYV